MNWRLYFLLLLLSAIWCSILISFPWLVRSSYSGLAAIVSLLCSTICHQNPSRSFRVLEVTLPVCSRCTAVYFGALGGIVLFPLARNLAILSHKIGYLLVISTMVLGLDVGCDMTGVWNNTFLSRSISGGFLGLTYSIGFLVLILGRPRLKPFSKICPI
jgi:uncharacterized membrane protein